MMSQSFNFAFKDEKKRIISTRGSLAESVLSNKKQVHNYQPRIEDTFRSEKKQMKTSKQKPKHSTNFYVQRVDYRPAAYSNGFSAKKNAQF